MTDTVRCVELEHSGMSFFLIVSGSAVDREQMHISVIDPEQSAMKWFAPDQTDSRWLYLKILLY